MKEPGCYSHGAIELDLVYKSHDISKDAFEL